DLRQTGIVKAQYQGEVTPARDGRSRRGLDDCLQHGAVHLVLSRQSLLRAKILQGLRRQRAKGPISGTDQVGQASLTVRRQKVLNDANTFLVGIAGGDGSCRSRSGAKVINAVDSTPCHGK